MEHGRAGERRDPELVGRKGDGDLGEVDEDGAAVPAGSVGELAAGAEALQRQEKGGGDHGEDRRQGDVEVNGHRVRSPEKRFA